jgi:Ca-activated chloride channel family protein
MTLGWISRLLGVCMLIVLCLLAACESAHTLHRAPAAERADAPAAWTYYGEPQGYAERWEALSTASIAALYGSTSLSELSDRVVSPRYEEPASLPIVCRLQPGEELWVIERQLPESEDARRTDSDPGSGSLLGLVPASDTDAPDEQIAMPLEHTSVNARIDGYIASVRVQQQYHNPFEQTIEAVYVFPLPHDAAVSDFIMTVGERRIRGVIRDREEARQIYEEARAQGYAAALLQQERPNIFTQKVANIEPGRSIDIDITYFNTLAYEDGAYSFVFPMVVGPRFNPPYSAEGVGAVGRGETGASDQSTEVEYLRPGERSGHDIVLAVDINAGVPLESLSSPTHVIEVHQETGSTAQVKLAASDRIPNRDFVLRFRVAGETLKSALLTHEDDDGGYFTLMLHPPDVSAREPRRPLEMVFVLDCSGSMSGEPMEQAKRAARRALRRLGPDDTFQIIRFSSNASQLGPEPIAATPDSIERGLEYLRRLRGSGGTMMIEGVKAALDFPHDPARLRYVCFLTDGFIGNEAEIVRAIDQRLGASRVFSVGIGGSVNRHLIDRMASAGRGASTVLLPGDATTQIMDAFFDRAARPLLTDLELDFGGAAVHGVSPHRLPDLFAGRPVLVTGRYEGPRPARVIVSGSGAEGVRSYEVAPGDTADEPIPALACIWARQQIRSLDQAEMVTGDEAIGPRIRDLALRHGLVSAYTSFIAVDARTRADDPVVRRIPVAVPVPEGVTYEGAVGDGDG